MPQQFLDKFRSSLPTTQGNHILKLLSSKKDRGQIKNIDEFRDNLKKLVSELLAERITPTLKLYLATSGEDIDAERYNEMLERIQDDLETAFEEANNIDEVIEGHHNLINNVALKTIKFSIAELESKISLFEFINKSNQGFSDALFNTFRESQPLSISRSSEESSFVFVDPRTKETVSSDEDAFVDQIGERLILGADSTQYLTIKNVDWYANSNSIRSEIDVSFPDSKINNILDNTKNTYWIAPILLSSVRSSGALMELALELGSAQDSNFIEIEPASDFPIALIGIDYIDPNQERKTLVSTEVLLTKHTRLNFKKTNAIAIILRLRQDNYKEIQFSQKQGQSNFKRAVLGQSIDTIDLDSIGNDLRQILSSDYLLNNIFSTSSTVSLDTKKYFEYIIGFDNIRLGLSVYQERSIYASKKLVTYSPSQIGIRTDEVRPVQSLGETSITLEDFTYPISSSSQDDQYYHSSIEYWVTAQFFSSDDYLIHSLVFPILPLGANRIYHERVIFTRKSDATLKDNNMGSLMFFANADPDDVIVYRNGSELTYGHSADYDWEFVPDTAGDQDDNGGTLVTSPESEITLTSPGTGFPMKRGIRIWGTVNPLDIYTVSYTPKLSNTLFVPVEQAVLLDIVDMVGDQSIRLTSGNIVVFDKIMKSQVVSYANFYLTIIMRRNSAVDAFSPALEEYMLVSGSRDDVRFQGED